MKWVGSCKLLVEGLLLISLGAHSAILAPPYLRTPVPPYLRTSVPPYLRTTVPPTSDKDLLARALEYFRGGKFHEALLLFQNLEKEYKLNARFRAYMGVCYYYDWDYQHAAEYLDESIPELDGFAPHERSIYYFAAAESHFFLEQYSNAIPYYERQLTVCYDNEKADAFYRIGFCYFFLHDKEGALENFTSALAYYETYRDTPDLAARIAQLRRMVAGLRK